MRILTLFFVNANVIRMIIVDDEDDDTIFEWLADMVDNTRLRLYGLHL